MSVINSHALFQIKNISLHEQEPKFNYAKT